jgi:hypothetical protein
LKVSVSQQELVAYWAIYKLDLIGGKLTEDDFRQRPHGLPSKASISWQNDSVQKRLTASSAGRTISPRPPRRAVISDLVHARDVLLQDGNMCSFQKIF